MGMQHNQALLSSAPPPPSTPQSGASLLAAPPAAPPPPSCPAPHRSTGWAPGPSLPRSSSPHCSRVSLRGLLISIDSSDLFLYEHQANWALGVLHPDTKRRNLHGARGVAQPGTERSRVDSRSRHKPRMRARPLWGACRRQLIDDVSLDCVSTSLSSPFLCL